MDTLSTAGTMLRRIHVQNFKSIADLTMESGQVNVLIGENGCGKSNFLEALTFASAAASDKLDNEFLATRGVRVTAPEFMRSAFKNSPEEKIFFDVEHDDGHLDTFRITDTKDSHYPAWIRAYSAGPPSTQEVASITDEEIEKFKAIQREVVKTRGATDVPSIYLEENPATLQKILAAFKALDKQIKSTSRFTNFLVYSPENSALRTFAREGQILPLGVKGEGLFKLLRFLSTDKERWEELKSNLKMIDWFRDLKIAPEQSPFEQTLQIHDRFLARDLEHFDQRSANEGFLFLLFYISLMLSPDTPSIFAIDNIDASLNPKTATALTSRLAKLAKKYNKQIFLTTHSPAVLDGLDLTDPEHRLFVFQRNRKGETRCRRVEAPQPIAGETPVKLSEAFLRGLIGGLPQNF